MKVSEVIEILQKIMDEKGDCEFHIYKKHSKETITISEICYDDSEKDAHMGVYAK